MSIREAFEKSDLCKSMVGNDNLTGWNLKRNPDDAVRYPGEYQWSRLEAAWQGFQAGAAYGSNQELTDILKLLDTAPGLPLDSCKPEELQAWTTAIKSVLVHIGAALKP